MLPRLSVHVGRRLLDKTMSIQKITECQFSRLAYNSIKGPLRRDLLFNVQNSSKVCGFYLVRYESTINTTVKENIVSTSSSSSISSSIPAPSTPVSSTTESSTPVSNTPSDSDVLQALGINPASSDVPIQALEINAASSDAPVQALEINAASSDAPVKNLLSEIPDPPVPLSEHIVETIKLSANGEPTFTSIGLGGWGPVGLIQWYYEWVHVTLDMPWWAVIALTSIIVKIVTFPMTLDVQRNSARLQNIFPPLVRLQMKMAESRKAGNVEEAALYSYELQNLLKENKVKMFPMSHILRHGLHIPIFIGLREMANTPVESLKQGGLYWFTDLTVADPYYILPACTSVLLFFVAEYAMKNANSAAMPAIAKHLLRGLPLISFFIGMRFPGVILCHWVTTNFFTIVQNEALKNEKVKKFFNIPAFIKHPDLDQSNDITKKKSFTDSFHESWSNMKLSNKLAQQARADVIQFNRAGKGMVEKTYKYNPKATTMSAMKK